MAAYFGGFLWYTFGSEQYTHSHIYVNTPNALSHRGIVDNMGTTDPACR